MEYNKLIADMRTGDDVEGFYVLKDAVLKTTAAGKPFLSGVLADRSGVIDLKVWDYSGPIGAHPEDIGRVVKIRGQVSEFKSAPQLTAGRIRMADGNDHYDLSALVPTAPIDADARVAEIEQLIDSMEDADYQSVARAMLARHLEAFRSIPAAKSVHHSFLSGLLMHTSNMLRLADFLAGLYGEIIDRSLLLTGTLLHDFAKEQEFTFSGLGLVTDYSLSGQRAGGAAVRAGTRYSRGKESASAAHDPLAPWRAGIRRGRAPDVRRGRAALRDRPHRQPHGDLRRGAAGSARRKLLQPHFRAGQENLPSRVMR